MLNIVTSLLGLTASFVFASGMAPAAGPAATEVSSDTAVHETLFEYLIPKECKVVLCLLSVGGAGIDEGLYQKLKKDRRVERARPEDFVFEHGAYKGFSERQGRILDVASLRWVSASEAIVDVNILTTSMNSKECRYRLLQRKDRWKVDKKATACTLS